MQQHLRSMLHVVYAAECLVWYLGMTAIYCSLGNACCEDGLLYLAVKNLWLAGCMQQYLQSMPASPTVLKAPGAKPAAGQLPSRHSRQSAPPRAASAITALHHCASNCPPEHLTGISNPSKEADRLTPMGCTPLLQSALGHALQMPLHRPLLHSTSNSLSSNISLVSCQLHSWAKGNNTISMGSMAPTAKPLLKPPACRPWIRCTERQTGLLSCATRNRTVQT